jgi:hypothetical protein
MWLLALAGIPLVVLGLDVLYRRRITGFFSSLVFNPNEPQLFEPRDVIWAAVILLIGIILSGFGLKELLSPKPVLTAGPSGLGLRLAGPFRAPVTLPWEVVDDIGAEVVDDDGDLVPVLWVRLADRELIPADPWGARWIDESTLAVLASDWELPAPVVAERVTEVAMAVSREQVVPPPSPPRVESSWPYDVIP